MTTRKYTSKSQQTTLTSSVTSGALTFPVVSATTLLGGATISAGQTFTVVIDPDTSLEEIVDITAVSSNNLTVTRSADGTSAQSHSAGAVIRHMVIGRDLRESNNHIEATGYYNDGLANHTLHGLGSSDGNVVGTSAAQTLTGKTIDGGSNTLTNIATSSLSTSVVNLTDSQTLTNKTLTSPTINTPTVVSATISGTVTSTATITGGTVNATTLQQGSVGVATLTDAQTLTNKTLTSPTINGGTRTGGTVSSATITSSTLGSNLAAGGFVVSGLGTPVNSGDSATKSYVDTSISNLVASAPATLDTLNELAAALGNDASFSTTITTSIATKLPKAGGNMTGAIDMGSNKITSLATPTVSTDAANKGYIDTIFGSTASAAASATAAATSATSAAASATAAATSATSAAASQTAAATSASSALTSQTAAATSASSAATSASSALTSQTAAATSATSAAASATAAATSAASAATSASSSLTSQTSAAVSATAAATSATSAAASATAAATSATSSAASASAALTSANSAATSASAALTSANSAATSAASAATSATSAATSASSSLATYNTYKTYYLGTFASAPTLDNQGNALIVGATYFNSVSSLMYAWSGSTWLAISTTTSYSAPTLGTTTINSGTTYSTLNGVTLTSASVSVVADPVNNLDVATKQYVDAVTTAINFHAPVQRATTANLTGTYNNGSSSGVGATFTLSATGRLSIDGGNVSTNDRILLKNQTTQFQNGIYVVTNQGGAGVAAVLTRATDYDQPVEITNGDVVFTIAGTQNTGVTFVSTMATSPTVVGTTAITFSVYTSASLPTQTGNAGSLLTTDGTIPSWTNSVTNLTLTTPTISSIVNTGTLSLPTSTDTLVGRATTDTLTNKTLTTPTVNGATISGTFTSTATISGGTLSGNTHTNATLSGTVTAGGSAGTSGYYLQTTGSGVQWAAVNSYLAPTLGTTVVTSGTTISTIANLTANNLTLTGTLTANAGVGTNGQVLQSTGTGVKWATSSGETFNPLLLMGA